ncbi:hypothetical protein E2C01_044690 [Portunus trituberculatus]|uniref:Uncharacterized protein n=1 Tax=Portunus trituberculatus TaxID=210409 RepID=A0A5B7FZ15_PORTR|nr:hypothetical protein [Portunus trituberculatus]
MRTHAASGWSRTGLGSKKLNNEWRFAGAKGVSLLLSIPPFVMVSAFNAVADTIVVLATFDGVLTLKSDVLSCSATTGDIRMGPQRIMFQFQRSQWAPTP